MARTDTLGNFLTDVADAIREKKGTSEEITASDFDTEIASISGGGGADLSEYFETEITQNNTSLELVKKIPTINIPDNITGIGNLFNNFNTGFKNTLNIKLTGGKNVTSMSSAFMSNKIKKIDLTEFSNNSSVTSLTSLCQNCAALEEITGLNNIKSNLNSFYSSTFRGCSLLAEIDISTWNPTGSNLYADTMFYNCTSLQKIDMRSFNFTNISSSNAMFGNVPTNCEIIVADDTQKAWINTNFSDLTNVKTVAEYEAEQNA